MNRKISFTIALTSLLVISISTSAITHAKVIITEIMYQPAPPDGSGNEWIEIQNIGNNAISLQNFRFVEDGTRHYVRSENEGENLQAGEVAIIARDTDAFLQVYPDYTKKVFRSSFSLRQKDGIGELLEIYNRVSATTDFSFTYTPDSRTDGTGASLHITGETQLPAPPTPGEIAINPITIKNIEQSKKHTTSTEIASTPEGVVPVETTEEERNLEDPLELQVSSILNSEQTALKQPTLDIKPTTQTSLVSRETPSFDGGDITTQDQLKLSSTIVDEYDETSYSTTEKLLLIIIALLTIIALELFILVFNFHTNKPRNPKKPAIKKRASRK